MVSDQRAAKQKWTVAELLDWTEGFFRSREIPTPRLDAELLLSSVLGGGRLKLYTDYSKPVDPKERARFRELVERRAKREPVAYLVGVREFYSLRFTISPAVLIPRPETEHLVDEALEFLRSLDNRSDSPRVLDLGTGSGNIAVAIASECDRARVTAVDVSTEALDLARRNASEHGVLDRLELLHGDLFDALGPDTAPFDLIVSNPPYIAANEMDTLMDDVRLFEPHQALLDIKSPARDGLGFYHAIAARLSSHLAAKGAVIVEVGEGQADAVAGILLNGLRSDLSTTEQVGPSTRTVHDYSGVNRIVQATSA